MGSDTVVLFIPFQNNSSVGSKLNNSASFCSLLFNCVKDPTVALPYKSTGTGIRMRIRVNEPFASLI